MTDVPAPRRRPRGAIWMAVVAVLALVAAGGVAWWALTPGSTPAAAPTLTPTATTIPTTTPTPTPTPTGYPADTADYALEALPQVDVFAVIPALRTDTDPYGPLGGEVVRAVADRIPVFADPQAPPVAALPREYQFDGTSVPVIERQAHWVHVLLTGRSAVPSAGDPGQLTGWVRAQDVESSQTDSTVEVDLAARTVEIVGRDGARERIATDFAWGAPATPTPLGRTFVMLVRAEPSFSYTRGHPLVYLGVQSPTLDGFGGAPAAVTAFHYHDARSGDISNGCLRVSPETIERLAQLPLGTPVVIR